MDTGSSNTWVGATTPFRATSTTQDTGEIVVRQMSANSCSSIMTPPPFQFVEYGSGFVLGMHIACTVRETEVTHDCGV